VTGGVRLEIERSAQGDRLRWRRGDESLLILAAPATIEIGPADGRDVQGTRHTSAFRGSAHSGEGIETVAYIATMPARFRLSDRWERVAGDTWRIDRRLEIVSVAAPCGVRLLLELGPATVKRGYGDFHYFAPPALYDLNDLNEDGVEDYLDTRSLHFRDDRLNLLTFLAYSDSAKLGFALSRSRIPQFDAKPQRGSGERAFLQETDIGSLGIEPVDDGGVMLTAAYPFAERTRSHALLVKERAPFAAFCPAVQGKVLAVSYLVRVLEAEDMHAALWSVWRRRFEELKPQPVALPATLDRISAARYDALLNYAIEETDGVRAAGFVTNCHPQDGRQLSNVIQFGFTGQNNLNAFNLLRAADRDANPEHRRKALRVLDFFVETAERSGLGLIPGFYNADTRQFGSWWTGLVLPLAYAAPGGDLERLMGPLYQLLRDVIEALRDKDGIYLRCVAEEHDALVAAYRHERQRGADRAAWLAAARAFAEFLIAAQEPDGAWRRAYTFAGEPMTEPASWFGATEVQQKSSTATVIPFLVALHGLTGDARLLAAAERAGAFVAGNFVDRMRFNGGIHDSIYARPQLVDGESIMFVMRALLHLHQATGRGDYLAGARRAAQLVVTWICLWDVPLPADSTLAHFGFRSTGWMACDAPGAGYIHPMGILAVPDLIEVGRLTGEDLLLSAAELLLAGCSETVALPGKDWGYAAPGLQEEGLLISWWFADDPMFAETGFGGRGKGEGNKTCLPWISAVSLYAYEEMMARYGTTDIAAIAMRSSP
jgi:hypothetical protein